MLEGEYALVGVIVKSQWRVLIFPESKQQHATKSTVYLSVMS